MGMSPFLLRASTCLQSSDVGSSYNPNSQKSNVTSVGHAAVTTLDDSPHNGQRNIYRSTTALDCGNRKKFSDGESPCLARVVENRKQ